MTYLTETEAIARLRAAIAKYPTATAFARDKGVCLPLVYNARSGQYNNGSGGIPNSVATAAGMRKRVVYELVEDRKERAA